MEILSLGFIITVFVAGLFSFFSPCILPVLPAYIGFLSSDNEAAGAPLPKRLTKTLAFIAGLSTSFFILGFGAGALGSLINSSYFFIFCGIAIVFFGVHQMGFINIPILNREKKLSASLNRGKGLGGAYALGFLFSFGWTPCIGPILSAVLGLSAQQGGVFAGGGLLLVYSLGLSIPFVGLTLGSLHLLTRIKKIYPYLPKIKIAGGVLIILMGLWMIFNQIHSLDTAKQNGVNSAGTAAVNSIGYDFSLDDIDGKQVSLSQFRGKTVYVKFWATWCPLCLAGLEDFTDLAKSYESSGDVAVLSVVAPGLNGEMRKEDFISWAKGQQIAFTVLLDETGAINRFFEVRAYPTSVFLDENGRQIKKIVGEASKEAIAGALAGAT